MSTMTIKFYPVVEKKKKNSELKYYYHSWE